MRLQVDFAGLPTDLQTPPIANLVGATQTASLSAFEACGAPGEVDNDAVHGYRYHMKDTSPSDSRWRELDWYVRSETVCVCCRNEREGDG